MGPHQQLRIKIRYPDLERTSLDQQTCRRLTILTVPPCRLRRTSVRLFIMLARQSATCCQMNLEIWTAMIVLNGYSETNFI